MRHGQDIPLFITNMQNVIIAAKNTQTIAILNTSNKTQLCATTKIYILFHRPYVFDVHGGGLHTVPICFINSMLYSKSANKSVHVSKSTTPVIGIPKNLCAFSTARTVSSP